MLRVADAKAAGSVSRSRVPSLVLPAFALTLFLSALLLFWVQPMFTKMVLPMLGGAPAVWNTAMLFFQAALLAGYAYAHLTSKLLALRWQVGLHAAIFAAALVFLPISVSSGWTPPTEGTPILWLIGLLAVSLGLPFFVVSATAPLLQRWFSHTGHRTASDPYYLYGASNIGSILALIGYPLLLEPLSTVAEQSRLWAAGFGLLFVMILISAGSMLLGRASEGLRIVKSGGVAAAGSGRPAVTWTLRLRWAALAFVPSSLMLGLTAFVTTDIAAVPLFWVVPLALYLLTFVLTFSHRQLVKHAWMLKIQPPLVLLTAALFVVHHPLAPLTTLHVATFFVCAMVCHGQLWRARPDAPRLTEFYLWMSFGGMLGGLFNAMLAPVIFDAVLEYPIALILACALRPWSAFRIRLPNRLVVSAVIAPIVIAVSTVALLNLVQVHFWVLLTIAAMIFLTIGAHTQRRQPLAFAAGIAGILAVMSAAVGNDGAVLERERSFFGVYSVKSVRNDRFMALVHGNTVHGAQFVDPALRQEPITYYHRNGPLGQVVGALEDAGRLSSVGTVGLGIGASACYRSDGQDWVYYEIDPAVTAIARDTRYFHFLSDCAPDVPVVHGDARLSLEAEPRGRFDLLILDAFASDSIPAHLMTRQAIALYLDKLAPDGLILFHISNRNMNLEPVLAALMQDAGLEARLRRYEPDERDRATYALPSEWVVAAQSNEALGWIDRDPDWRELTPRPGMRPWTDDYSHILSLIRW